MEKIHWPCSYNTWPVLPYVLLIAFQYVVVPPITRSQIIYPLPKHRKYLHICKMQQTRETPAILTIKIAIHKNVQDTKSKLNGSQGSTEQAPTPQHKPK